MQYYSRPFIVFHKNIENSLPSDTYFIRNSYWSLVPNGVYGYIKGKELVEGYFQSLEKRLSNIIRKYSYAYWYHLSRRISPWKIGLDDSPTTITITRNVLTLAIQKYAKTKHCGHISPSKNINIKQVFNGLLLSDEFKFEKDIIENSPNQLVLTDFTQNNLYEYYIAEKLAYEIWACGAKLRSLAKGSQLLVDNNLNEFFSEIRNEEQAKLIQSYDKRFSEFCSTKTGTVFRNSSFDPGSEIFLPVLNAFTLV